MNIENQKDGNFLLFFVAGLVVSSINSYEDIITANVILELGLWFGLFGLWFMIWDIESIWRGFFTKSSMTLIVLAGVLALHFKLLMLWPVIEKVWS